MTIDAAASYFNELIEVQQRMTERDGSPLVFVLAVATIEYLSKLAAGKDNKRSGYTDFARNWMSRIRSEYRDFKYKCGDTDLPDQMYHILRCGLVHSFSFVPDFPDSKGRSRSIVLGHRVGGGTHLTAYSSSFAADSVMFIAEDFLDDIQKAASLLFEESKSSEPLRKNIQAWLDQHPPIVADTT